MTDTALVTRLKRNDHAAYDELVAQYGDSLYSYIYLSTRDRKQSEALLATVFLRVVERINSYNPADRPLIVWLYRLAHTVVRDTLITMPHPASAPRHAPAGSSVPAHAIAARALEAAHAHDAFVALPCEESQIIMLSYVAGMNLNDVGYVLGKNNRAVNQLQFQALRALGAALVTQPLNNRR